MDFQVLQCFGIGTCEFIESLRPPCQNSTSISMYMILYDLCHAHHISSIRIITSHAVRPFRADSGIASAASTWSTLIGSLLPTWACQVSVVAATASASFLRTREVNDVNIFKQESSMKKSSLSPLYISLFYEFSQTSILEDFRILP